MSAHALLRILFRWKRPVLGAAIILGLLFIGPSLFWPLKYESHVILERKPVQYSPQPLRDEEFDVFRLTSETQRSVALLKSRFLLETWYRQLGLPESSALEHERGIKKLHSSLTVQPVNYTDLFVIRVQAKTREEATRRAGVLCQIFMDWDSTQNKEVAQELTRLLKSRMGRLERELADARDELKQLKRRQALSLSGSQAERQLETDVAAKEKLFDTLTQEVEEATRRLDGERIKRTRIVAPAVTPEKPVRSRKVYVVTALMATFVVLTLLILFLEWQDPALRRVGEILRQWPQWPVLVIPEETNVEKRLAIARQVLSPIREALLRRVETQGSVIVQIASPSVGDGKTTVLSTLQSIIVSGLGQQEIHVEGLPVQGGQSLEKHMEESRKKTPFQWVEHPALPMGTPVSTWIAGSDVTVVVLAAGQSPRSALSLWKPLLSTIAEKQSLFIVLNHYVDPLPAWLRSS